MINNKVQKEKLPKDILGLSIVRFVVSAGSFVGPFLTMMLTLKLGYNEAKAGIFMSAVSVVSAVGLLLGGKLGDSFDRPVVLRTLQVLTACLMLLGAALGFSAILPFVIAAAMACLQGSWPVMNAIVADVTPPSRRKEAFSLMYWANNIGFSAGPLIAGFLFNRAPRLLFVGNASALLLAAFVVSTMVKGKKYNINLNELLKSLPDLNADHDGLAPQVDTGPQGPAIKKQMLYKTQANTLAIIFANPLLWMYGLVAIVTSFIYSQQSFALPVFLKDILGSENGPRVFGFVMSANGITVVALTIPVMFLAKKMSSLSAMALSAAFYAIGFGSYFFASTLLMVIASTVVWTIGEILGATSGNAYIAEHAAPAHRSRINSVLSLTNTIGSSSAPLVSGPLARAYGSKSVWPLTGLLSVFSAMAFMFIRLVQKKSQRKH